MTELVIVGHPMEGCRYRRIEDGTEVTVQRVRLIQRPQEQLLGNNLKLLLQLKYDWSRQGPMEPTDGGPWVDLEDFLRCHVGLPPLPKPLRK